MKKLLFLLLGILLVTNITACGEKELAKLADDGVAIYNVQNGFDPSAVLTDIKQGTAIETELDREKSELIITLTNGSTTMTLIKKVEIQEPLSTVKDISGSEVNGYNFNIDEVVTDIKEGTEVSWNLEGNELTVTLVNGNQTDIIKQNVNVVYPLGWFNNDSIRIDTYNGYDINSLISLADGVKIVNDELKDNILTVTLSDGTKEETINSEVELYSSVMVFDVIQKDECGVYPIPDYVYAWIELREDGTFYEKSYDNDYECTGTWDENGTYGNCAFDSMYTFTSIADDWSYIKANDKAYCGNDLSATVELVRQD